MAPSIWLQLVAAALAVAAVWVPPVGILSALVTAAAIFVGVSEAKHLKREILAEIKKASDEGKAFSFFMGG
jgi:hypothetical protein